MNIKIVVFNLAVAVFTYVIAAFQQGESGMQFGFGLTTLQLVLNILMAILCSVTHLIQRCKYPEVGDAMRSFWVSVSLVVIISFPTCLLIGK